MPNYYIYIFLGLLSLLIYLLTPPKYLREIPTVPVLPYILSSLRGKPSDKVNDELISPILRKHGIAKVWLGRWIVLVSDLDSAKKVFFKINIFGKDSFMMDSPHSVVKKFFGTNVVFTDGEEWKRHRKAVSPIFHRTWPTGLIGECFEVLLKKLSKERKAVEILPLLKNVTLDVLGKVIFNYEFNAMENPDGEHVVRYTVIMDTLISAFYIFFPFLEHPIFNLRTSLREDVEKFRGIIEEVLNEKKKLLEENEGFDERNMDFLTMMIQATMSSDENEVKLTEEEMIDNVVTFFAGGHDTTANTLAFVLYYIAMNPEVQEKARKEVREVMEGKIGIPNHDQLKSLHYITAIIHEAMRMKPTFDLTTRVTKEPVEIISGKFLPKGQDVAVSLYNINNDPKHWSEPQVFRPDRFLSYQLDEDGKERLVFDKSATKNWYGFSGGPRSCAGASFAIMEQRILLVMLLNRFSLSMPLDSPHMDGPICNSGTPCFPVDLKIEFTEL